MPRIGSTVTPCDNGFARDVIEVQCCDGPPVTLDDWDAYVSQPCACYALTHADTVLRIVRGMLHAAGVQIIRTDVKMERTTRDASTVTTTVTIFPDQFDSAGYCDPAPAMRRVFQDLGATAGEWYGDAKQQQRDVCAHVRGVVVRWLEVRS